MPRKNLAGNFEGEPNYRWVRMVGGIRWRVLCRAQKKNEKVKPNTGYLGLPESEWTEQKSQAAANAWWESKLGEILASKIVPEAAKLAEEYRMKAAWFASNGEPDNAKHMQDKANEIETYDASSVRSIRSLDRASQTGAAIWQDRLSHSNPKEIDIDRTIGGVRNKYLEKKLSDVKARSAGTVGSYDNVKRQIAKFVDFVGELTPVEKISAQLWEDWFNHLAAQEFKPSYKRDILVTSRDFVNYCFKKDLCGFPKNLNDDKFEVADPEHIETFSIDEVKAVLATATGQLKLHCLIMLNCGYTQQDISDLTWDQVDLQAGVIKRKRSKTRGKRTVPVVSYKLWKATIAEFNKFKSSDPKICLLTERGKRWVRSSLKDDGKLSRTDAVDSCFDHLRTKLNFDKSLKIFRKTSANLIGNHEKYRPLRELFLGQSNKLADLRYVNSPDALLAEAITWLGKQYGIK